MNGFPKGELHVVQGQGSGFPTKPFRVIRVRHEMSKRPMISSNGVEIEVGQTVVYSVGTYQTKCIITDIKSRRNIKLEAVAASGAVTEVGNKYTAKDPQRLWVLQSPWEDEIGNKLVDLWKKIKESVE